MRGAGVRTIVPADAARQLLLGGQGLLDDPARRATPAAVYRQIERMGFVQVDTINVVSRAHDHILSSRFDGYRPAMLQRLLERDRALFEHWTHDAAIIPTRWFPYWRPQFARHRSRIHGRRWWLERLGDDPRPVLRHVRARIRRDGPLLSRELAAPSQRSGGWWGWSPQKVALEYLWRIGELAIAGRVHFHKLWDLTERVIPAPHRTARVSAAACLDFACRAALERLGVATARELQQFFDAADLAAVAAWCERAARAGAIVPVAVEAVDGTPPRRAWAAHDWHRRAARLPPAPARLRLLSPFDPVIRDRARLQRLFGFDYRVEVFVPEARRTYGYYVLPILAGDRLVGRLDPKLHRDRGRLDIRRVWWEPGVRVTGALIDALEDAVARLARQVGATEWRLPR